MRSTNRRNFCLIVIRLAVCLREVTQIEAGQQEQLQQRTYCLIAVTRGSIHTQSKSRRTRREYGVTFSS